MRVLCAAAVRYEVTRDCDDQQVLSQARLSIEDYFNEEEGQLIDELLDEERDEMASREYKSSRR